MHIFSLLLLESPETINEIHAELLVHRAAWLSGNVGEKWLISGLSVAWISIQWTLFLQFVAFWGFSVAASQVQFHVLRNYLEYIVEQELKFLRMHT